MDLQDDTEPGSSMRSVALGQAPLVSRARQPRQKRLAEQQADAHDRLTEAFDSFLEAASGARAMLRGLRAQE